MVRECFYCGRRASRTELDHAPMPKGAGGVEVVPACMLCHNLKDRFPLDTWPLYMATRAAVELASVAAAPSGPTIEWPARWDDMTTEARILWAKLARICADRSTVNDEMTPSAPEGTEGVVPTVEAPRRGRRAGTHHPARVRGSASPERPPEPQQRAPGAEGAGDGGLGPKVLHPMHNVSRVVDMSKTTTPDMLGPRPAGRPVGNGMIDATILRADARNLPLADSSVDLIVTSPPYFGLRSYQDGGTHYSGQIGDEATPAEFVDALVECTREWMRVLKPSGSIWVNLGDKYAGPNNPRNGRSESALGNSENWKAGLETGYRPLSAGVPNKSLIGVPWRYAIRCIDDLGLILRAEVIWSKPNGLPESVTDRVRRSHETWFHFTKSPRYFSAVDEIREEQLFPSATRTKGKSMNGGSASGLASDTPTLNPLGKLPGSVWTVPTQPLRVPDHLGIDHFAAFPMEFPRRIIRGWSPSGVCVECGEGRRPVSVALGEGAHDRVKRIGHNGYAAESHTMSINHKGSHAQAARERAITGYACACPEPTAATTPGVVLDPFGGTGTTALVAKALGRHGISNDMSADYCRLATWRTSDPGELARALQVEKPAKQVDGQGSLLDLIGGEA